MRTGEAIAALLEQYGVDTVFGIPGVHTLEYYRGLAGSGIRPVLARHEGGAGFMADGYARATGRPGVCCVISGPGVTNVATPMGQAFSDSIPMLVLASVNRTASLGKGWGELHESVDQLAVARPLAGVAATAYLPDDVPDFFRAAYTSFACRRPRPAFLQVPTDVLEREVEGNWCPAPIPAPAAASPAAIRSAVTLLQQAQRPALLIGGGAVRGYEAVRNLAARLGVPVITTIAGKGIVPETGPLSLGAGLAVPAVQKWLASRDLVLAVGTELAETDMWGHRVELPGLIRVDIDPGVLAGRFPARLAILADAAVAAIQLSTALDEAQVPQYPDGSREVAELKRKIAATYGHSAQGRLAVLQAIRSGIPVEGRIFTDMTQLAYIGNHAFPVDLPSRWFHPSGFGTLGYAVPAAIGALFGDPETPTYALAGDAGLLFTIQEMATAVEYALPLVIILWNNDSLQQIQEGMEERAIPPTSVQARNPDFAGLARAFGFEFLRPGSVDAIAPALREAHEVRCPVVVELRERELIG